MRWNCSALYDTDLNFGVLSRPLCCFNSTRSTFSRPSRLPATAIAELVERPTLYSCRYKIPHQDGMNLADVFGHFEAAKAKVCTVQYRGCKGSKRQRLPHRYRHTHFSFLWKVGAKVAMDSCPSLESRVRGGPAIRRFCFVAFCGLGLFAASSWPLRRAMPCLATSSSITLCSLTDFPISIDPQQHS